MESGIPPYVFDIFVGATALGVLIQAGILLGMFIGLRKFQVKMEQAVAPILEHALPILITSRALLEDLSPKLKAISENLSEISETVKNESHNIKGSVDDVLVRTRAQTARVDEMVSGTLDGLTHAATAIQRGIEIPLRKTQGVVNGFRAGIATLRKRERVPQAPIVDEQAHTVAPVTVATVEEVLARVP